MEQHVILCGLGKVGWRVLEYLQAAQVPVTVIDTRSRPDDPRLGTARLIQGDCRQRSLLDQAGLANARGVIIVTSDDLVNLSTALLVRNMNEQVRVVVRMFNQNLIARLGEAVRNMQPLSTSALAAPLLALTARTGEALGAVTLPDNQRLQLADFTVAAQSPFIGKALGPVIREHDDVLIGHRQKGGAWRFLQDVDDRQALAGGDRVIVCGRPKNLSPLLKEGENESLPELLWAGWGRRLARMIQRTVAEVDLAVKVCTGILLAVIGVSVIIFHFGKTDDPLIDAFYRTISLIATGADMRGNELERGNWQKLYISFLRLIGTALIAAFTAIFTNYLLRARLGGALEVRRIPDRGHVIVCGLGNIGFRVVQELLSQGERVVAIERSRDNPYIPTARRLGAAVIIGDAVVPEVLKQAHAANSRSVVAATSNDLLNLEIALLARDLKDTLRVVVRLGEADLAQTMRTEANIRLAFSIPELAAPAFVAGLLGNSVRGLFMVESRLFVAVDLTVGPGEDRLVTGNLRELAGRWHFVPMALFNQEGKAQTINLEESLHAGDTMTVMVMLKDLPGLLTAK